MSAITTSKMDVEGLADLLERLGNVPLERVRIRRPLGLATEQDLIEYEAKVRRRAELVDGVIVEKAMGWYEDRLGIVLIRDLETFAEQADLGFVLGAAGMVRIEGQVREPDVAFYAWSHFPGRLLPPGSILGVSPDLAVEILSETNTAKEMERKRREYFQAGTKLVWEVDPEIRLVRVYTDAQTYTDLHEDDTLDGGAVLPGFTLSIRRWFERAGRRQAP